MAYYDEVNNTQAIRWTDQTIPNVNTGEWNTTITVKATIMIPTTEISIEVDLNNDNLDFLIIIPKNATITKI